MAEVILQTKEIEKTFSDGTAVKALDKISLQIREGEILGVVGESGSGKSTLVRAITRLVNVDSGEIILCGENITHLRGRKLRACYGRMQVVFQDAVGSFDERMTIGKSISELLENQTDLSRREREKEIAHLLERVGLKPAYSVRYPGNLSGGECQRAAIARAIATKPRLLICDEATSACDVSMQAQVVELIKNLAQEMNIAVLFISHDLALVNSLCDNILVMYRGQVVEAGVAGDVIRNPQHIYTKRLKNSVFQYQYGDSGNACDI